MSLKEIRDRVLNMILDNGLAVTLAVAFCVFTFYIMKEQQQYESKLFLEALEQRQIRNEKLLDELLECLKR